MNYLKNIISIITVLAISGLGVIAQQQQQPPQQMQPPPQQQQQQADIPEEKLDKFVAAVSEVQTINQSAQQEMMGAIQEEGLDIQRFNEIMQAKNPQQGMPPQQGQQGKKEEDLDISDEELQKYEKCEQKVEEIQQKAQKKMEGKIQEEGLDMQEYQQILMQVQQNPQLQQKIQQKMMQEQGGQQQQGQPQGQPQRR